MNPVLLFMNLCTGFRKNSFFSNAATFHRSYFAWLNARIARKLGAQEAQI
jgi:hypothetical protein